MYREKSFERWPTLWIRYRLYRATLVFEFQTVDDVIYNDRHANKCVNCNKHEIHNCLSDCHFYQQAVYRTYIINKAASASHRGAYQEVCQIIRRYAQIVGKQHQQSIVEELRNSYRRKPAFMDELSRFN